MHFSVQPVGMKKVSLSCFTRCLILCGQPSQRKMLVNIPYRLLKGCVMEAAAVCRNLKILCTTAQATSLSLSYEYDIYPIHAQHNTQKLLRGFTCVVCVLVQGVVGQDTCPWLKNKIRKNK